MLALVVLAFVGPHIVPFDPENYFDYDALNAGPSAVHWFGVDSLGRDIFSRIITGTRISLAAGFFGRARRGDRHVLRSARRLLRRLVGSHHDARGRRAVRVPGILLAIGVVAILGNGWST